VRWKATSGGRPNAGNAPRTNVIKKGDEEVYLALPKGRYIILANKETTYRHDWYEIENGKMVWKMYQDRKGGVGDGNTPSMQDKEGKVDSNGNRVPFNWFIPIMPVEADNYRGRIKGAGRLGIHPDGPSQQGGSYFDGTEGCIGIREDNTADLYALFDSLTKTVSGGKNTDISNFLYVSVGADFNIAAHSASPSQIFSLYGNRPAAVSIIFKT
jgi:L,D-transpeptidase catalytic domain.